MNELTIPAIPTLTSTATTYIAVVDGKLVMNHDGRTIRSSSMIHLIDKEMWRWQNKDKIPHIVVPNDKTVQYLMRAARKLNPSVATRLSILASLSGSSLFVQLDKALSRKFVGEEATISGWVKTLGIDVPTGEKSAVMFTIMEDLFDRVCSGTFSSGQAELVGRLEEDEQSMVTSLDPYRQFAYATNLSDSWMALQMADPVGRTVFTFDGSVIDATVTHIVPGISVTVRAERSPKFRSGKMVTRLLPDSGFPAWDNEEFRLLRTTLNRAGQAEMLLSPKRSTRLNVGDAATFMEAPFLMKTFTRESKWRAGTPIPPMRRTLPDDLLSDLGEVSVS